MGAFGPSHIAIIVLAFIILFGYKRLPDASRSLGRSLRILKAETKGLAEDGHADKKTETQQFEAVQPVGVPAEAQPVYAHVQASQPPVQASPVPVATPLAAPVAQPAAVQYVAVPVDPATGLPVAGYIPPAPVAAAPVAAAPAPVAHPQG